MMPLMYAGMRIYVSYPAPKVVVGKHWWLSDELREAMQARMVARFGYRKGAVDQGKPLIWGDKVFVHPADMVLLRATVHDTLLST